MDKARALRVTARVDGGDRHRVQRGCQSGSILAIQRLQFEVQLEAIAWGNGPVEMHDRILDLTEPPMSNSRWSGR